MKKILSLLIFITALSLNLCAQQTKTIWIVRHAEKVTTDPKNPDPALNEAGLKRAEDLKDYLSKETIDHIFTTPYTRTKQTALPLAKQRLLEIETYDAANAKALVQKIKGLPDGKNILVIGHSNTVLPIVKELGANPEIQSLTDDDYDFLFEITIKGEKVKLKVIRFGEKHHTTEI